MDHPFRNATFGGFHKQDVLDFLEKSAKEHSELLQEMQRKLESAQHQLQTLTVQQGQSQAELTSLREQQESLTFQRDSLQQDLAAREEALFDAASKLDIQGLRLSQLEQQVLQLQPDALAYSAIKERTAGVELDAHRRAQEALDDAERQAQALRTQMEQWIGRVSREYARLRSQVDAAVAHSSQQLKQVEQTLVGMTALLEGQDIALEALGECYTKTNTEKKSAPMPISEDI